MIKQGKPPLSRIPAEITQAKGRVRGFQRKVIESLPQVDLFKRISLNVFGPFI